MTESEQLGNEKSLTTGVFRWIILSIITCLLFLTRRQETAKAQRKNLSLPSMSKQMTPEESCVSQCVALSSWPMSLCDHLHWFSQQKMRQSLWIPTQCSNTLMCQSGVAAPALHKSVTVPWHASTYTHVAFTNL